MGVLDLRSTVRVQHQHEFFSAQGTYWTEHFEDRDITQGLADAAQAASLQADLDNTLAIQVMQDREGGQLYRTILWHRVRVWEQNLRNTDGPGLRAYGFGGQYGADQIPYGGLSNYWVADVTPNMAVPRCLVNRVTDPTYIGHQNSGFFYRPGVLGMVFNPFASEHFVPQSDQDGRYVDLWFYLADFDVQAWSRQYGIAVQATGPTSEAYRALIDGLWRARVAGPSDAAVFKVIEGCTGVPLVHTAGETVQWVGVQGPYLCVVTDQECYRFPSSHTSLVEVGDAVVQGQALTDALSIIQGSSIRSGGADVVLPAGMFGRSGVRRPIKFPNARVAVEDAGLTQQGNRITRFLLHGEGQDLIRFRNYAADQGLWRALDQRGRKATTVAGAQDLVATVNPAVDLAARHTIPHLTLVDGDPARWPAHPDLQAQLQRQLDRVSPPHAKYWVQAGMFTAASSSYSSQSWQSSSSSTAGDTQSTMTSASSASTQTASTASTGSTGSSLSFSSDSDRSSASTATSASSISSLSSQTPFSASSLSSNSFSSESLSTQSLSSQSTRSSQSQSSRSTGSSASTASSVSSQSSITPTSMSLSSQSSRSESSSSSSSSLSVSLSTQSTDSSSVTSQSGSSLSTVGDTPSSASTASTQSGSSVSTVSGSSQSGSTQTQSTQTLSSDSSKSSRSNSSLSRSFSSVSTQSLSSRSSQSERSQSSQTESSQSSLSSNNTATGSTQSLVTVDVQTLSSASSNSASSGSADDGARRMAYYTAPAATDTWALMGKYSATEDRYYAVRYITNSSLTTQSITPYLYANGYTFEHGVTTTNPMTDVNGLPTSFPTSWTSTTYATPAYTVAAGATIWVFVRSGVGSGQYGAAGSNPVVLGLYTPTPAGLSQSSQSTASSNSSSSSRSTGSPWTRSASSRSLNSLSSLSTRSSGSSPTKSISSASTLQTPSSASSRSSDSSRSNI